MQTFIDSFDMSGFKGTELGKTQLWTHQATRLVLKSRHLINNSINICVTALQIHNARREMRPERWLNSKGPWYSCREPGVCP